MSAVTFPEGAKAKDAERGEPRQRPPIPFVPKSFTHPMTTEDTTRSVYVKLDGGLKEKVNLYKGGDTEELCKYYMVLDDMFKKKNLLQQWNDNDAEAMRIVELGETPENESALLELRGKKAAAINEAFNLVDRTLDGAAKETWRECKQRACDKEWKDAQDAVQPARGKTWESLAIARRFFSLTVMVKDAAEQQKNYHENYVKQPRGMKVRDFVTRNHHLNAYYPYLLCMADTDGAPDDMPREDTKLTEMRLSQVVLRAQTRQVQDGWYAIHGSKIPTDVNQLRDELDPINVQVQRRLKQDQLNRKNQDSVHGSSSDKKNGTVRFMSGGEGKKTDTGRIPRKPKGNGNKGDEQQRHCNLCAQFGGNHSTHNTSVCRRWTKEGKQQAGWKQQRPNGNGKRDFAASLEKQEKEIHALKKLLKKKHKKRKRAYQYASDSSSDEESK